ncbi:MAG: T9SS type A sorting domain-containing protein [Bacteroidia bacterium]
MKRLIFLGLLINSLSLFAQKDLRFQHFAPHDRILDITSWNNDIWIHTLDGIVKMAKGSGGLTFFDETDTAKVKSNNIHGLARFGKGGSGVVIVTYDFGLVIVDSTGWHYLDTANTSVFPSYDAIALDADSSGDVWVLTASVPALLRYSDSLELVSLAPVNPGDSARTLTVEPVSQHIWIGTDEKLLEYNPDLDQWSDRTIGLIQPLSEIDHIFFDQQNRIWLNTKEDIWRKKLSSNNWMVIDADFPELRLSEDDNQVLWATRNVGWQGEYELFKWENGAFALKNSANSVAPFDGYFAMFQDPSDSALWMGGFPGQLTLLQNTTWQTYRLQNTPVVERKQIDLDLDRHGNMWILTEDSLRFNINDNWNVKALPKHGPSQFTVISEDSIYVLYGGTDSLAQWQNGSWQWMFPGNGLPSNFFPSQISVAGDGALWLQNARQIYRKDYVGLNLQLSVPLGDSIRAYELTSPSSFWWSKNRLDSLYLNSSGSNQAYALNASNQWQGDFNEIKLHTDPQGNVWLYNEQNLMGFNPTTATNWKSNFPGELQYFAGDDMGYFRATTEGFSRSADWNSFKNGKEQFTVENSPMRPGKIGKVVQDPNGNFWLSNQWDQIGGLTIFNGQSIQTSIKETLPSVSTMKLFPNPNDGHFTIRWDKHPIGEIHWRIFDLMGQQISDRKEIVRSPEPLETTFDLELAPGIYFLQWEIGQIRESKRILIQ